MKDKTIKLAFVTKWALTKGILEVHDPEICEDTLWLSHNRMVRAEHWYETLPLAQAAVHLVRSRKISSLKKQVAKLEKAAISDTPVKLYSPK